MMTKTVIVLAITQAKNLVGKTDFLKVIIMISELTVTIRDIEGTVELYGRATKLYWTDVNEMHKV